MIVVKAIVKSKSATEIRRLPMSRLPGELTYDELCIIIHRMFKHALSPNIDNLILRYIDEDGDLVCLETDIDISHALSQNPLLRVHVFDKEVLPIPKSHTQLLQNLKDLRLDSTKSESLKSLLEDVSSKIEQILKVVSIEEISANAIAAAGRAPSLATANPNGRASQSLTKAEMASFESEPLKSPQPAAAPTPSSSAATAPPLHQPTAPPPPQQQQQQYHQSPYTSYGSVSPAQAPTGGYGTGAYTQQQYAALPTQQQQPQGPQQQQQYGSRPQGYPATAPPAPQQGGYGVPHQGGPPPQPPSQQGYAPPPTQAPGAGGYYQQYGQQQR
ncbi:hypothetical protein BJ742DRAFT_380843 [Cladochytrium replicatum]|nr:hypothetical protein BJ742DRAFT_380843 [Cladochytrium replicatum]